jgi:hypothetical protein
MATLGSLAVVARVSNTERFLRSSRLNQTRIHPPTQVVLKNYTRDLDLFDRALTKLPANPAGHLQPSTSLEFAPQDGLRTACFTACAPAQLQSAAAWIPHPNGKIFPTVGSLPRLRGDRKNINVKRVNC